MSANGYGRPYSAGEKVATVLEYAHAILEQLEPPAGDRGAWLQLFALRQLVKRIGGVPGVLSFLPPVDDAARWDALLELASGVLLELRSDEAEPIDVEGLRYIGAAWLERLMADTTGEP